MASDKKQYGLIIPKKFNINEVKRAAVFNNESDSEDDSTGAGTSDWIKKSFQKQAAQSCGLRRQTEIDMKRALDQDPTVYKYDEIYDELEKKKASEDKKKHDAKKPRYIQNLLKKAQQRKLENERRVERQVQKERDAEGEQFKDKETFVTSAYKKKLEEFHKLDEEERKQDMLEELCDVSKQQDLGGFYRHLFKTTVDKDESDTKDINQKENSKNNDIIMKDVKKNQNENRQYRKRKTSESSSLEEGEHNSDSDTSIESSASEASMNSTNDAQKPLKHNKNNCKQNSDDKEIKSMKTIDADEEQSVDKSKNSDCVKIKKSNTSTETPNIEEQEKLEIKEERPKINIWEKRTVGSALDAALERYFKRKSERLAIHGN